MDREPARSRGVSQTLLATAADAPSDADVAFDSLYRSSRDDVYAYAASLLRDVSAAEEVTATAFERAYRKRSRFDPSRGEPRAWLFGIVRNAALDELRRRGRQAELTADPIDVSSAAAGETVEQSERRLALANALDQLSPPERELVALKFFAGLDNSEIATVLGVSESNAGTRLHRVMTKLREASDGIA
jgi:RNA polymerase sigma-70 factor, ECF subfamily